MRSGRLLALALASLLALPTLTLAQQGHHRQGQPGQDTTRMMGMGQGVMGMMGPGMMGQGMMGGMMGMMAGPGPAMILAQKETLKLEPSQVKRLEELQDQMASQFRSHMGEVAPLMTQAREALQGDEPDLSAYEEAIGEMAEHHTEMMVERARISQSALAVLNEQQRTEVRAAMGMMRQMMGGMMQGGGMGMANCPALQPRGG